MAPVKVAPIEDLLEQQQQEQNDKHDSPNLPSPTQMVSMEQTPLPSNEENPRRDSISTNTQGTSIITGLISFHKT